MGFLDKDQKKASKKHNATGMKFNPANWGKALGKRFLSYLKKDWSFEDYPLAVRPNPNAGEKKVAYVALITNWDGMVGHGETANAAAEALRSNFELFKANNELPRPGTHVPLKFASTENIDRYRDIAEDYLYRMFGLNYNEGFYSDGSVLRYFSHTSDEESERKAREHIINRTLLAYNVDITDIYDEPLWKILKKIKEERYTRR